MYLIIFLFERVFAGWIGSKIGKGKELSENKAFWIGFFFGLFGWIYINGCKEEVYDKNNEEYKKDDETLEKLIHKLEEK